MASLVLAAYAALLSTWGVGSLRRARWPERAPTLAVLTWLTLVGSVLLSVVLGGLALAVPMWPGSMSVANLLDTCVMLLRAQYSTPGGAGASTAGIVLALGVTARAAYCLARCGMAAQTGRVRQREQLAILARRDDALGAVVLEHPSCAAYCIPGRTAQVVLTSGTLQVLDADQVAAVLEHERAHLRGRHHLVILFASSLSRAFAFVPAFRLAADEVARLAEMIADDAAAPISGRMTLATALVRLAEGDTPVGALGAGGSTALTRVLRLAGPERSLGGFGRLVVLVGVAALALGPLIVTSVPALSVASSHYCPISMRA